MTAIVTIDALGQRGEGIAEIDGQRVLVPLTLPGEMAEIDVQGDRGTLVSLRAASPARVDPFCRYFGICGGCALQHAGPGVYSALKRRLVVDALRHRGIETVVSPLVDARGTGRRRATLHAAATGAGYMRARSHELLDIERCPILVSGLRDAAPQIARAIGAVVGNCDVLFTAADNGIDVAVRPGRKVKPERLVPLAQRLRLTRLALDGEIVFQLAPPKVRMGPAEVELPVGSFLQATAAAEAELARLATEAIGSAKAVADLFCGVGPFSLRLAEHARVGAFDADRPAIASLDSAARHTQGLKPIVATARDLFRDPLGPAELGRFDAVVFDPPRAGAEAQARELARSRVKTIVSVSCEPRSFARDAVILIGGGYRLDDVTPVDQFAWSPHVEMVGVFRR